MLPRNLTIICIALVISTACHLLHRRTRTAMLVGEAMEMIERFYVEPVDERTLLISAMDGMTNGLDAHSEFIPPRDYRTFQDSIMQEFAGIGIYVDQPAPNAPVRVITPLVGSPALRAGLLPNDKIIEVDGEVVAGMDIREVSERLRGPIGTNVRLLLRRGEEEVTTTVVRDTIQLESVLGDHRDEQSNWVFRLKQKPQIAYIRATTFGDKTVSELGNVLQQLDNDFDALVLDLRGNGGGLLTAAVEVSDMFLDSGRIVATKIRGGITEEEFDATHGTLVNSSKPIAVLIDENSASASEIVAAALQDHERALIAGTRSFGKGTVQNILLLEYGRSALRLTVAKYYRPSDKNIHRDKDATEDDEWGVSPNPGMDVHLEESALRQLAIKWQESSYPSLKGRSLADRTPDTSDERNVDPPFSGKENAESEPSAANTNDLKLVEELKDEIEIDPNATAWDLDAPLRTAVEALETELESRRRDGSPRVAPGDSVPAEEPSVDEVPANAA